MSAARSYPAYGALPGGAAIVAGGGDVDDTLLASAERFEPATNTWSAAPSLDAPRYAPGTLTTGAGRLMLVGGIFLGDADYTMYDDSFQYRPNQVPAAAAALVSAGGAVPNGEGLVRVTAAGSADPDGDALTFTWRRGADVLTTTTSEVAALGLGIGMHELTLTVADGDGAQATASLTVTVLDATAPFAQQIADLTASNAALSGENARLTTENAEVTTQNTQLTAQNAQLTTQNTHLTMQNSQLASDNALLTSHAAQLTTQVMQLSHQATQLTNQVAQLTKQLQDAEQRNAARAAINAVELAMRVRFRNPSFHLPGFTPEQKLASVIVATLTGSQNCQQQIYRTLGGRR
jgi:hypothetical protein